MMYGRGYYEGGRGMMGYATHGSFFGPLLGVLFFGLLVTLVVLLVVWAVRASRGHGATATNNGTATPVAPSADAAHAEAVAIAKKRLATGEITAEQYQEIMAALAGPQLGG